MKEKIIQKASNMFITLGFKSVTMDDIASEIGISKKTIYAHFKTKTSLVKETTKYMFETVDTGINSICSLEKDPIEEIFEIKYFLMEILKDEKSSPLFQLKKYYPAISNNLHKKKFELMISCTLNNLKRGINLGIYRPNLDINFVSRIYFVGINGIKNDTFFPSQDFPKSQVHEEYLEYHLRGIVTPKGLKTLNKFIKTNE
ncbi:transcriptional regulator, tetR family protein [unidentified eubacterium SCB49]|nr:transcriptional regulator, tetR family protein [unidentified eubacterium SCB49]